MMSKSKWVAAAALLVTSTGALADGTYEFDSITALRNDGTSVTGVLVNDTVPTTLTLTHNGYRECGDWLELMMKQPGIFTLKVTVMSTTGQYPSTWIDVCTLTTKP